ncbi:glycosyltransferase [Mesobaculum littorinae]|uniref:Glycosyltransferase n=1 Tax=Mesobaculum littorinae TaxID=2486419 RepID=A0A438AL57_9RHOB|nr:TIGR04283 family arsenosugar biosynthesis glycosyltransferase [Mesobaculum littorinae]RVV99571.1 glycosyltransferase [Mesobaculum littorinae]
MPAPLSIVIPTLNAADALAAASVPLVEGVSEGLVREMVVADGGSTDATRRVAEDLGAAWVPGPAGRGGQIARGVAAARGDWLLILHADCHLPRGWTDSVARHMGQSPERAGYFRLAFRATGLPPRLVAGWANLRAARLGLPYGDQGLLIARDVLARAGGVPDLPLMEDVALARALRGRLSPLDATITTSAERYLAEGWLRRGGRNLGLLARYLAGADSDELARAYAPRPPR